MSQRPTIANPMAVGKIPPQNVEAERAVLGAVLTEPGALLIAVRHIRTAEAFYRPEHQHTWNAVLALSAQQEPVTLVTVQAMLRKMGVLEEAGGPLAISELAYGTNSPFGIESQCLLILDEYARRQLISLGQELLMRGFDPKSDSFELL